jgi:hypothetical protein
VREQRGPTWRLPDWGFAGKSLENSGARRLPLVQHFIVQKPGRQGRQVLSTEQRCLQWRGHEKTDKSRIAPFSRLSGRGCYEWGNHGCSRMYQAYIYQFYVKLQGKQFRGRKSRLRRRCCTVPCAYLLFVMIVRKSTIMNLRSGRFIKARILGHAGRCSSGSTSTKLCCQLPNRSVLSVSGSDSTTFLNGIVASSIREHPFYTAFLSAQVSSPAEMPEYALYELYVLGSGAIRCIHLPVHQ